MEDSHENRSSQPTQTQPEVSKLISDIFGESDDDDELETQTNVIGTNLAIEPIAEEDDLFSSDDDDDIVVPKSKSVSSISNKKDFEDTDIFGSDDEDDLSPKPKRLRLEKGKSKSVKKSENKKKEDKLSTKKKSVKKPEASKMREVTPLAKKSDETTKEVFGSDSEDSYDSGGEGVRTAADDNFIDQEDENADLVAEYEQDVQHFDDERPDKHRRSKDEDRIDEDESNPLAQTLKGMKKKKSTDLSEQHKNELAEDLLKMMDKAAANDVQLNLTGQPALCKLNMLSKVQRLAGVKSLQMTLLDFDLLGSLKTWIEPRDKNSPLAGLTVRTAVYELLRRLPCQMDHLKRSGIGKALISLRRHEQETPANKRLIKDIIDKWCRPIFGKSADVRSSVRDDDPAEASRPRPKPVSDPGAAEKRNFDVAMSGSVAMSSKDSYSRVQCPRNNGFVFKVRPESKVDRATVREATLSGTKGELMKRMKSGRGGSKSNIRAMEVALSGRDKA